MRDTGDLVGDMHRLKVLATGAEEGKPRPLVSSGYRLDSTHSGQRVTLWLEGSQEGGGVAHQWRQPGLTGGQATSATPCGHLHGIG